MNIGRRAAMQRGRREQNTTQARENITAKHAAPRAKYHQTDTPSLMPRVRLT